MEKEGAMRRNAMCLPERADHSRDFDKQAVPFHVTFQIGRSSARFG
jgi:hypothetical protein